MELWTEIESFPVNAGCFIRAARFLCKSYISDATLSPYLFALWIQRYKLYSTVFLVPLVDRYQNFEITSDYSHIRAEVSKSRSVGAYHSPCSLILSEGDLYGRYPSDYTN